MPHLTETQKPIAKLAIQLRYYQHRIAAYFGINQGRISEFKNSAEYGMIIPAVMLPSDFPAA